MHLSFSSTLTDDQKHMSSSDGTKMLAFLDVQHRLHHEILQANEEIGNLRREKDDMRQNLEQQLVLARVECERLEQQLHASSPPASAPSSDSGALTVLLDVQQNLHEH